MRIQYIWTNHLSKINNRCTLVGTKTSIGINKRSNTTNITSIFAFHIRQPSYLCNFAIQCTTYWGVEFTKFIHKSFKPNLVVRGFVYLNSIAKLNTMNSRRQRCVVATCVFNYYRSKEHQLYTSYMHQGNLQHMYYNQNDMATSLITQGELVGLEWINPLSLRNRYKLGIYNNFPQGKRRMV